MEARAVEVAEVEAETVAAVVLAVAVLCATIKVQFTPKQILLVSREEAYHDPSTDAVDVLAAAVVVVCTVAVVEVSVPVEMRPALFAVVLAKREVDAA